jgi:hypothetical protein
MPKLRTSEIINLIAAIDDSILMNWEPQSDRDESNQFPGWKELPPVNYRQGALITMDAMLALSEDPEFMKLWTEVMGNGEHESER